MMAESANGHSNGVVNNGFTSNDVDVPVIPVKSAEHQVAHEFNIHFGGQVNQGFIPLEELREPEIPKRFLSFEPHKPTFCSRKDYAVCVRNAYKSYGSSKHPNKVLQNLNMTVPRGAIYGLLGASGCGKTTLLSCLVGRRNLNSGDIWVLGGKPGTKNSGIPGRRVGYMPQEIALYPEFSICETMMYYGWIFGMGSTEIQERLNFLLEFLDLPTQNRLVKNLSGGQQRRVSFAVALLHDPELLILDEPTVGVDPLLRKSIWDHLVQITKDGKKTVIITTHYIEEARQAHCIGLMRSGKLLAEDSPAALLSTYNCQNLEDVFLMLSRIENMASERQLQPSDNSVVFTLMPDFRSAALLCTRPRVELSSLVVRRLGTVFGPELLYIQSFTVVTREGVKKVFASLNGKNKKVEWVYGTDEDVVGLNFRQSKEVLKTESDRAVNKTSCQKKWDSCKLAFGGKMRALLHKNFLRLLRNLGVMLVVFALPILLVVMFCFSIGLPPKHMSLGIVNKEMNWTTRECPLDPPDFLQDPVTHFSCHYINMLSNDTIVKNYYENLEDAMGDAKMGKVWGILYFPQNFSENLFQRYSLGKNASSSVLEEGTIRVWLDMSNQQIGLLFQKNVLDVFMYFSKWMIRHMNTFIMEYPFIYDVDQVSEKMGGLPIQEIDSIYSDPGYQPTFQDFCAPGVILTLTFFLSVSLTSSALIIERLEGTQDRAWVAGVTPVQLLFSQVITQFTVMCCQAGCILIFTLLVFGIECKGGFFWVILLTLLQGLNGMSFGFAISAICDEERNAIQVALGSFYPTLMLSGVIWPLEGMSTAVRYSSYFLPLTLANNSLRYMLSRAWSIDEPEVYYGFLSTTGWIVFFLTLCIILMRRRTN